VILRCTKKLFGILGPVPMADPPPEPDEDDWYANVLWFERRKCLLLTHAGTLFTVFAADIRVAELRDTGPFLSGLVERQLLAEDLPAAFADTWGASVHFAKTADRSVLGCMNDMALTCEDLIYRSGSPARTDLASVNHFLHRNINRARDYQEPIVLMTGRLQEDRRLFE